LWLEQAEQAELDYDVVGLSLYPFWSNLRVGEMKQVVTRSIEITGKQVLAVETGYPWTLDRPSGYPTMIESNDLPPQGLETFGVSPRGQELFLRSLFQQLHDVPGFLGASYWDPIWIETPMFESNVGDTALFDWEGAPLQALDAFGEKFR
jgi:arabinogalactan endo-1,4-beta-galactosidase